jgi:hypothetical protein
MRPALVLALVLALVGCSAPNEPAPVVTTPAGAASPYVPPPTEIVVDDPPERNEDGRALRVEDGVWVVGVAIAPGFYRSTGTAPDRPLCSWSVSTQTDPRGRKSSGAAGQTIAAGVAHGPDQPQRVALSEGQELTTAGCATWLYYGP